MRLRVVLMLCAVFLLAVGVATATAGGGNSGNAQLCHQNGWQSLFDLNGGTFMSEEACVAYGAQGGTILTTNPYAAAEAACASVDGTFSTDPSTDQTGGVGGGGTFLWSCNAFSPLFDISGLQGSCTNAGGQLNNVEGNERFVSCFKWRFVVAGRR